jgi:serine phosphatase RsbU (regulator of sigma subunit)
MGALGTDNYNRSLEFSGLQQDMLFYDSSGNGTLIKGAESGDVNDVETQKIPYDADGAYYLYSSGFFKQVNEDGIKFSNDKFQEMMRSINDQDMADQLDLLQKTLSGWTNEKGLIDDLTVIGFRLPE